MLTHQHLVLRMKKVEQFYDEIEGAMADSDSRYKIITGDFNAKIHTKLTEEDFKSMGVFSQMKE